MLGLDVGLVGVEVCDVVEEFDRLDRMELEERSDEAEDLSI